MIQEPLPDLVVTSITPPSNGVFSGQSVPITYTVENVGDAPTSVPVWHDFVILSQDPITDVQRHVLTSFSTTSRYSTEFNNPSYLGVGQSYQKTVDVTLADLPRPGPWYVYVVANGLGSHYHYTLPESNRTNNLLVSAASMSS